MGPLKLSLPLGDHQCHAYLPDGMGGEVRLPGVLTLEAGRRPRAELHGEVPLDTEGDSPLSSVWTAFPQATRAASLRVHLVSGLDAVLLDCIIDVWFPGRVTIRGSLAVVGHLPAELQSVEFSEAVVQVTGLDAVLGRSPLERNQFPVKRLPDEALHWSSTERLSAREMVSADEAATVGAHWYSSYSAGGGYQTHRIVWLRLRSDT